MAEEMVVVLRAGGDRQAVIDGLKEWTGEDLVTEAVWRAVENYSRVAAALVRCEEELGRAYRKLQAVGDLRGKGSADEAVLKELENEWSRLDAAVLL